MNRLSNFQEEVASLHNVESFVLEKLLISHTSTGNNSSTNIKELMDSIDDSMPPLIDKLLKTWYRKVWYIVKMEKTFILLLTGFMNLYIEKKKRYHFNQMTLLMHLSILFFAIEYTWILDLHQTTCYKLSTIILRKGQIMAYNRFILYLFWIKEISSIMDASKSFHKYWECLLIIRKTYV